jgi:hypothetical protein
MKITFPVRAGISVAGVNETMFKCGMQLQNREIKMNDDIFSPRVFEFSLITSLTGSNHADQ